MVPSHSQLNEAQRAAVQAEGSTFLLGPAGTGKSSALYYRLLRLLNEGTPAYTILALVTEVEDRQTFLNFLDTHEVGPYADLTITTFALLARDMVRLFWPLVAEPAGFEQPRQPPTFLSYDLAQLLMWRIVTPMLEAGAFADLRLRPQQIINQLLDTLNRAALNRLTLDQAAQRQIEAWGGAREEVRHLQEAARAARRFRAFCLAHSLLDLSLTAQVFDRHLVGQEEFYRYFGERFRHLIVDNIEEQTPAGQHFLATLMDVARSTAIAYDAGGGYKRFLAADPTSARQFRELSAHTLEFEQRFTSSIPLVHLSNMVENYLVPTQPRQPVTQASEAIIDVVTGRYRRDMVLRLIPVLSRLIHSEGVAPQEIALIAPYLDGALVYMLEHELEAAQIPYTLQRRRSSPRQEPRVRAWLTWLELAHPDWEIVPTPYDVAEALTLSIAGLDPARAELLTDALYRPEGPLLLPAANLDEETVERVGVERVQMVEQLRQWLETEGGQISELDVFLQRLFDELLARPPLQPEPDVAGAAVSEWLIRTAGKLQEAAPQMELATAKEVGLAFITTIEQGLSVSDPPELGEPPTADGVLITNMYGYLLGAHDVRVQVWLEASGAGWWDIPRQPLSNAFVLARSWPADRVWTMDEDFRVRNRILSRLIRGLVARCRDGVVLAASDLDRRGQRQDGPLWRALQPAIEQSRSEA